MTLAMTLLAAAAGTAAALLGLVTAHLDSCGAVGAQAGRLGVALGCESVLAIPAAAVGLETAEVGPALNAVELVIQGVVVALLLVTLIDPEVSWPWAGAASLGAAFLVAVTGAVTVVSPDGDRVMWTFRVGLGVAWGVLASVVASRAAYRRAWALCLVAAGIALLGGWHAVVVATSAEPFGDSAPLLPVLRLAVIGLVLWGTLVLLRRAMTHLDVVRDQQEEELRLAAIRLAEAAQRDHELRCGLAGLAGAARLRGAARPDAEPLDSLVVSELTRLEDLLETPAAVPREAPTTSYDVEPVLEGLVILRRAAGMALHLEVEPGLSAVGSSATLAQVVANLLNNAERHAPSSQVCITARRSGERVVVRLRDFGPGVAPGQEDRVFEVGMRDEGRGGSGLGLDVCRRMLAAENGSVAIRRMDPESPGCVVVLELPARPAPEEPTPRVDPADASCAAP